MLSTRLVAAACIFSIMYVNCINVRYGTRLTDVFGKISITFTFYQQFSAYAKVIALVVLIFTGLYYLFFTSSGQVANFTTGAWTNSKYDPLSIVIGLYQGLFSYSGWDTLNFLVEELQDPFVNMPKVRKIINSRAYGIFRPSGFPCQSSFLFTSRSMLLTLLSSLPQKSCLRLLLPMIWRRVLLARSAESASPSPLPCRAGED